MKPGNLLRYGVNLLARIPDFPRGLSVRGEPIEDLILRIVEPLILRIVEPLIRRIVREETGATQSPVTESSAPEEEELPTLTKKRHARVRAEQLSDTHLGGDAQF